VFVFTDPDTPFHFIEGNILKLNPEAEEVMTFYAKMLDHDYTTKKDFNKNFFGDWRKVRFVRCSYQFLAGKLCTWASEGFFQGRGNRGEISFFLLCETKRKTCFY